MAALMSSPDANNSDPPRVVAKLAPLDREPCLMGNASDWDNDGDAGGDTDGDGDGRPNTMRPAPRLMGSGQHVMGQS